MIHRAVRLRLAPLKMKNLLKSYKILHQDADLLIIEKPAGMLVHPSVDTNRPDLQSLVQIEYPQARLLHRLDYLTSGVLVFGLSDAAQRLFKVCTKWYLLVIGGQNSGTFTSKLYLKEKGRQVQAVRSGGKTAITFFESLAQQSGLTLVKARLITGRRHQIRVAMACNQTPLIGDSTYGGISFERLMLHAVRIDFEHFSVQSAIPPQFLKLFPEFNFDTIAWFKTAI